MVKDLNQLKILIYMGYRLNMYSMFFRNSKAKTSELLENIENDISVLHEE